MSPPAICYRCPVIISQKTPLPDAEARDGEEGKLEKYFSEKPGEGG